MEKYVCKGCNGLGSTHYDYDFQACVWCEGEGKTLSNKGIILIRLTMIGLILIVLGITVINSI